MGLEVHPNREEMRPMIAEMLSDETIKIEWRKSQISEEEWERCWQMGSEALQATEPRIRDGRPKYSGKPSLCVDCHRSGSDFVRAFSLPGR